MLVIKRKGDETITIEPMDGLDMSQTVEQLFSSGPIEITFLDVGQNQVKIAIDAPSALKIWRGPGRRGSGTVTGKKDAA